jgi:hypothetical protein
LAPSTQKVRAIFLPMPLAAPVTTTTLLLRCIRSFSHCLARLILGDVSEAGGALADVSSDRGLIPPTSYLKFRPLVAAVPLQVEDRDTFVVSRSLQDIRMA